MESQSIPDSEVEAHPRMARLKWLIENLGRAIKGLDTSDNPLGCLCIMVSYLARIQGYPKIMIITMDEHAVMRYASAICDNPETGRLIAEAIGPTLDLHELCATGERIAYGELEPDHQEVHFWAEGVLFVGQTLDYLAKFPKAAKSRGEILLAVSIATGLVAAYPKRFQSLVSVVRDRLSLEFPEKLPRPAWRFLDECRQVTTPANIDAAT